MRKKLISLFLVLVIGMGLTANLTAVTAEELTDYVIDLTAGGTEIQQGSTSGTVKLNQAGRVIADNLDPAAYRFIFTTNGLNGSSFGIQDGVSADLNLVFRDCRVRQNDGLGYSAYNDFGTGLVKLTLEGTNELWSGKNRSGLRIPSGRTYEVRGSGQLSVKGDSPIGVYGDDGYESAGTLILYEGTIRSDDENKSNATICYMGGSLKVTLRNNATVKNDTDVTLYPVKVDFSEMLLQPDNMLSVNGTEVILDEGKIAYLYLAEGTDKISYGKIGEDETEMEIPAVSTGSNATIKVRPVSDHIGITVLPSGTSATLYGVWGDDYTGSYGFEYKYNDYVVPGTEPVPYTVTLSDGEKSSEISDLQHSSDYICRAWGTKADETIIYSDWVNFRTKSLYNISIIGGTVTEGTLESDGKYLEGSNITVTADGSLALFEGWYDGSGILLSDKHVYTFVLTEDISLEARYYTYDRFMTIEDITNVISTEFESGGELPWKIERLMSEDPFYLRSGAIGSSQNSSLTLRLNLSHPQTFSFQWKVSSEARCDELKVLLDGTELSKISGEQDWAEMQLSIPTGEHTIEWKYTKDRTLNELQDCGYLKELKLVPIPQWDLSLSNGSVTSGEQLNSGKYLDGAEITVTADEISDKFFEGWYDESGTLVSEYPVYTFIIEDNISLEAKFKNYSDFLTIEDETGIDALIFENSGALPWIIGGLAPDDPFHLRSGAIGHSQNSSLTLRLNLSHPQTFSFQWKVSSEEKLDELKVLLDGKEQSKISGEQDWAEMQLSIPTGEHTIEWKYTKSYKGSVNQDCGYLKELKLVPTPQWDLSVSNGIVTSGEPLNNGKYSDGMEITVTADENSDKFFEGWYDESDTLVSEYPVYTFNIEDNISLEAKYKNYSDFMTIEDDKGIDALVFKNSGALPWIIGGLASEDPLYLRSGAIDHSQGSSLILNLNLSEAYRIDFQWKVSSEEGWDNLSFILNGEEQESISGQQDWKENGISVPAGTHTIEWRYTKDSIISKLSDCGYLKGLRLTPVSMVTLSAQPNDPAYGSVSPESVDLPQGANVSFTAFPASGYHMLYWQDESGKQVSYDEILTVPVSTPQTYTAVFDVLNHDYSALLTPESEKLTFGAGGSVWTMQPDGSARSGSLDKNNRSVLRTTVTVPEGEQRVLLFDWRNSARNDYMELYVNGIRRGVNSGVDSDWEKGGLILQTGTYTLEWVYQRDELIMLAEAEEAELLVDEAPEECGWVKNIMVRTPELYDVNIACEQEQGSVKISWESDSQVDGKFYEGTSVGLSVTSKDGYYFKEWQDGEGNTVSTNPYFSFIVSGDKTYTAIFEPISLYDAIVEENSRPYFTFNKVYGTAWSVADGIAKSGKMDENYSVLNAVVTVPQGEGAKLLTFEWKVSSNSYGYTDIDNYYGNFLMFNLDGDVKANIVGVYGGWARYAVVLEEGEHEIEWAYYQDSQYTDGENCGWLRNVELRKPSVGSVSLNVTADMNGNASAFPIGEQAEGTSVQMLAVAKPGYACVGWKDQNGNIVSEFPKFTAYVYGDQTYTPIFEEESVFFESSSARAVITSGFKGDKTVIFAAYKDGRLTSCAVSEEHFEEGKIRIPAPSAFRPKPDETVKVFVWDDLDGMKPAI